MHPHVPWELVCTKQSLLMLVFVLSFFLLRSARRKRQAERGTWCSKGKPGSGGRHWRPGVTQTTKRGKKEKAAFFPIEGKFGGVKE